MHMQNLSSMGVLDTPALINKKIIMNKVEDI